MLLVLDINSFIHAFRGKDEDARAEIDTYQPKQRRLLPDVRDPPEQGDEEVDMTDI